MLQPLINTSSINYGIYDIPISKHDELISNLYVKYTQFLIVTIKDKLSKILKLSSKTTTKQHSKSELTLKNTLGISSEYDIKLNEYINILEELSNELKQHFNTIKTNSSIISDYELFNNIQTNYITCIYLKYLIILHTVIISDISYNYISDEEWIEFMKSKICKYTNEDYDISRVNPDISYKDIDSYLYQLYIKYANILIYMLKYQNTPQLKIKIAEFVFMLNKIVVIISYYYIGANVKMQEELDIRRNICRYLKYLIKNYDKFSFNDQLKDLTIPNFVDQNWENYKNSIQLCVCNDDKITGQLKHTEDKFEENIELYLLKLKNDSTQLNKLSNDRILIIFNYNYNFLVDKLKNSITTSDELEFKFFRDLFINSIVYKLLKISDKSRICNILDLISNLYKTKNEFIIDMKKKESLFNDSSIIKYLAQQQLGGKKTSQKSKIILNNDIIKGSKKKGSKKKGSKL